VLGEVHRAIYQLVSEHRGIVRRGEIRDRVIAMTGIKKVTFEVFFTDAAFMTTLGPNLHFLRGRPIDPVRLAELLGTPAADEPDLDESSEHPTAEA
jgi:hypothetical protein